MATGAKETGIREMRVSLYTKRFDTGHNGGNPACGTVLTTRKQPGATEKARAKRPGLFPFLRPFDAYRRVTAGCYLLQAISEAWAVNSTRRHDK